MKMKFQYLKCQQFLIFGNELWILGNELPMMEGDVQKMNYQKLSDENVNLLAVVT